MKACLSYGKICVFEGLNFFFVIYTGSGNTIKTPWN